jgi:hypothetical protein
MVDTVEKRSFFEKYGFPLFVSIVSIVLGILLQKFVLSESHRLVYSISESSPIEVHGIQYFPVAFNVTNSGNTALEDVVFRATFGDSMVTVRTEPPLTKAGLLLSAPDPASLSTALELAFDLARGETHAIMVVAQGPLQRDTFFLKSKHVMGELGPIKSEAGAALWIIITAALLALAIGAMYRFMIQFVRTRDLELKRITAEKDKLTEIVLKDLMKPR